MATKKTTTKSDKAAKASEKKPAAKAAKPKAAKAATSAAPKSTAPRHPHGRVEARHQSKAELAKALAPALVRGDEDKDALVQRLSHASNSQLLRLGHAVEHVNKKYGSRDKLIAAIGTTHKKSKDKDFLAKLATYTLPQLLDLARA